MQNKQVNFENDYFIISDCNLQKILLGKKKKRESLTNERFNEQYSKDSLTSEKENEIKVINKILEQKSLNSKKTDNLKEECYSDEINFINEDKPSESIILSNYK